MRLWLVFALLFAGSADAAASSRTGSPGGPQDCVAGPAEPSISEQLRPTPTLSCRYDAAELHRRILRLLRLRRGQLSIETVERLFGLPQLTTAYDDPRSASFHAIVRAAPGSGDWLVVLSFSETFGPDIDSRPLRFRGTLRPVRINRRERGDMRLDLEALAPRPLDPASPRCLPPDRLRREARLAGWDEPPILPSIPSHGPPRFYLEMSRDDLQLSSDITDAPPCIGNLLLLQAGNPPVEPVTAEESDAIRRRSAESIGDEMAARIMARPANSDEDRDARRAQARFMRDSSIDIYLDSPRVNRRDRQIEAMSIEQLRDLARRTVGGHYWGVAREDCEAAIREEDPPAALRRRARERGLSEVEADALGTLCYVFIDGRRYHNRPQPQPPR